MSEIIPVIIPSLEPDQNLLKLIKELKENDIGPIVVIDDGSGPEYGALFKRVELEGGCILLRHAVNLGKGRALKDCFSFCLKKWPEMIGCITADSDGQHSVKCIKYCIKALFENPQKLILGVRDFSGADVPRKSKFGNNLTKNICKTLCGINISDTQTGLRGIPAKFMKQLMSIKGERFEFETRMLLEAKGKYPIIEVPIQTIYDSKEDHATHFDPIRDSVRIYLIFIGSFAKFIFSSLSSSIIDLLLFSIFCRKLNGMITGEFYVAVATVLARIISAIYNYLINYRIVFHSETGYKKSVMRYCILAAVQMLCSAGIVTGIAWIMPFAPKLAIKIPVDIILFFISFIIQREYVYGVKKDS